MNRRRWRLRCHRRRATDGMTFSNKVVMTKGIKIKITIKIKRVMGVINILRGVGLSDAC
jgi:hypothetical protein